MDLAPEEGPAPQGRLRSVVEEHFDFVWRSLRRLGVPSEAVDDAEIALLTNYVAAGGTLMMGSSAFTRQTNGAGRGDFAFAGELGLHMSNTNLTNWARNTSFSKSTNHRLVSHFPSGVLNWRMPLSSEDISWGTSPAHVQRAKARDHRPSTVFFATNPSAQPTGDAHSTPRSRMSPANVSSVNHRLSRCDPNARIR